MKNFIESLQNNKKQKRKNLITEKGESFVPYSTFCYASRYNNENVQRNTKPYIVTVTTENEVEIFSGCKTFIKTSEQNMIMKTKN